MITSTSNARIKHVIELQSKSRTRRKENLFVAEGFKMFEEAPVNLITEVYIDESTYEEMKESSLRTPLNHYGQACLKVSECIEKGISVEAVSGDVFSKICDTETPQGIVFVGRMPEASLEDLLGGNILILENIQDPGNLGTMIRTAEGAGMAGIIMTKGTVDIFNPKTVRSTMGSLFRVPFVYVDDICVTINKLKSAGITVYAAHLKGTQFFDEIDYTGKSAVMIGNEGNGLSEETAAMADVYVKIPMQGKLESLNAAVAAALLMYEIRKK